jgi:uncharacterized repeat protein (TIGR01451 family)
MKSVMNISLLLMVFILFGCHDKKAQDNIWGIRPIETQEMAYAEQALPEGELKPVAVAPLRSPTVTPSGSVGVTPERTVPISVRPNLVTVNESGAYIVSMVYPSADYGIIQVDKSMPREVRLNQPFDYSIRITNLTDIVLNNVTVTEELPRDFQLIGASPSARKETNKLVWMIDSFRPKETTQFAVSGIGTSTDNLENSTTVTYAIQVRANVRVVQPKLELTIKAPSEVLLCDQIPLEFVVSNVGSGFAQNVKIVNTLPAGLQTVEGSREIAYEVGTLLAGQSQQFSTQVRATRTGVYVYKAVASSTSGLMAESATTVTTVRQPRLTIVTTGPSRQYLGRSLDYEITVTNRGDGPAKDTVVEMPIPAGAASIEATTNARFSGTKLIWQLDTLEASASKRVRVSYVPTKAGTITNTATVTAYCAETATASTQTMITGLPAIRMDVIDLEDPIEVGHPTTYVITVTNQGTAADTNIRIVCHLEDKVQYISSAGDTSGMIMGNAISFAPLHSLAPRDRATWRIVVKGVSPGDVRFRVTMSSDQLARPVEETEATRLYE